MRMVKADESEDKEIAAIGTISVALAGLSDAEARQRVISYVLARYLPSSSPVSLIPVPRAAATATPVGSVAAGPVSGAKELPGIARLTDAGDLQVTIRDLKARSGLDAAVRLAYVAIYAYQQLAGQAFSSPKGLTPLLKTWRVYDGNSRTRLAKDKGILRNGDDLSLDAHATRDAERFIQEMLDDGVAGSWKPR
jgi:hypothetical protein